MADKTFTQLFGLGAVWPAPFPGYPAILGQYTNAATDDEWKSLALSYTDAMPNFVAFVAETDPGVIFLGHSATLFRPLPTGAIASLDDNAVVFMGDQADSVIPHVLPDAAFGTHAAVTIHDTAANTFAALQVAATNTIGPLNAADPGMRNVNYRRTIVLPPAWGARLLQQPPMMSTVEFYNEFLAPIVAVPADAATHQILLDWWQTACCLTLAGGHNRILVAHDAAQPPLLDRARLQAWSGRTVARLLGPVPSAAGPPLHAVTTAVDQVRATLAGAEAARAAEVAAEAARRAAPVSYTDRFGTSVAQLLRRYCRVNGDADLPELHLTMASYDKRSRDSTTLNLVFASNASHVPAINETNLPKSTPYLLELIRGHNLVGNSFELGEGLNPFSIICVGHPNTKDVLQLAERQSSVENGSSVSLNDAIQFRTKDGRFPKTYLQATDKLWGLVLFIRVYFGARHVLYTSLLASVQEVGPMVLQLESLFYSDRKAGLLIAIKVLLYYQHMIGLWLRKARDTSSADPIADPDFSLVLQYLRIQSYDGLPRIPDTWMDIIRTQMPELYPSEQRMRGGGPGSTSTSPPSSSSSNAVQNARPDRALLNRWTNSNLNTIGLLKDRWNQATPYAVPKDGNNEICLKYHLTGKCKSGCARASTHKHYTGDMITAIHTHLDNCGVAR